MVRRNAAKVGLKLETSTTVNFVETISILPFLKEKTITSFLIDKFVQASTAIYVNILFNLVNLF
jgi:hypothetical protein